MNKCEHIKAQLLDLDVLTPIQDPVLEQHLKQCSDCAAYLQDLLALQNQVDHLPEHDVSDDVFAKTLAAVQQEANSIKPKPRSKINHQWASGLAASFVLVAVAGLLYNGSISNFQGDFSQVSMEAEQEPPAKPKPTPWIDPAATEEEITVELVDLEEVQTVRQRRMSNLNQPSQSAVGDTLKQIKEAELGALAPEPTTNRLESPPVMPDLLRDSAADLAGFSPSEPTADAFVAEAEPVMAAPVFEDKAKVVEKKKEAKPGADRLNEAMTTDDKHSGKLSLDQLKSVSQPATTVSEVRAPKRAADFHAQRERQVTLKADSAPADGLESHVPQRDNLGEDNKGYLRKDYRDADQALVGGMDESDDETVGRITVTGSRIKRQDMVETAAAEAYLADMASIEGLTFKSASGYWANTYLPGDSNMRWLQAKLKQGGLQDLPEARPNAQPFDAPQKAALAMYLASDHHALNDTGPTRMRLQVGLQAGEQQGGHRSALNLAVVLDVSQQGVEAEVKALLANLLKNKQAADRVTVFSPTGQIIAAADFKHGPIQVAIGTLFNQDKSVSVPIIDLPQSIEAAYQWLGSQDDPNAVLGSSALWLVSANSLHSLPSMIDDLVHQQATEGITFSTVAIGSATSKDRLERLALQGQGHSRVMNSVNDAQRVVNEALLAASRAVARALRLQIRLADGVQLIDVLGSYPLNEVQSQQVRVAEQSLDQRMAKNLSIEADRGADEDGIQIVIPSFFAGDTHVVLLDVLVNQSSKQSRPIAEVNAKYKDLIYLRNANSSQSIEMSVGLNQLTPLELNVMKNVLARRYVNIFKQASDLILTDQHPKAIWLLDELLKLHQSMRSHIPAWKNDEEIIHDEQVIQQFLNLINGQSAIDPQFNQLIADAMQFNSWRRLLTHGP